MIIAITVGLACMAVAAAASGAWFAAVALGGPVAIAALPLLAREHRAVTAVLGWLSATVVILWSLVLGLGLGPAFLPTAALLLAAAIVQGSWSKKPALPR